MGDVGKVAALNPEIFGPKKTDATIKSDRGTLSIATGLGVKANVTLTLDGRQIPITFVLPKDQTDKLISKGLNNPDAIKQFLAQLGMTEATIKLLQDMGITGVDISADGKVTLSSPDGKPLHDYLTTGNIANDEALAKLKREIMAMPAEIIHAIFQLLIEEAKKDEEKQKEFLKQLDALITEKKAEQKSLAKTNNEKNLIKDIIKALEDLKAGFQFPLRGVLSSSSMGVAAVKPVLEAAITAALKLHSAETLSPNNSTNQTAQNAGGQEVDYTKLNILMQVALGVYPFNESQPLILK